MIVVNDGNNLVFDDNSADCLLHVAQSQGQLFAFIQCIDASLEKYQAGNYRLTKRYWGQFAWNDQEHCIREIMRNGGKWQNVP
ncbi:MAG: hypothetical protein B0D91_13345 [Oceanospirillales bacterium LUC14_002_19_P2]|nr:MAG: hypothetical protein B0D91_13345 [Oceanospirillales bacterium LUC14_002_19_P2]